MKKLKLLIELEYDEDLHGDNKEDKLWFYNLLKNPEKPLVLYYDYFGDEIGPIKVLKIED